MKKMISSAFLATALATTAYAGGETPSNPDAVVYFVNINDGDTVSNPVTIVFGLRGMGVAPSGTEKRTQATTTFW